METDKINVPAIDVSIVTDATNEAQNTLAVVRKLEIKDQEQYSSTFERRKQINARIKELDEKRKSITAPLDVAKKNVMDLFRAPINFLTEAMQIADTLLLDWNDKQETIRKAQEDKLRRETEKKQAELQAKADAARAAGKEDKAEQYEDKAQAQVAPVLSPTTPKINGGGFRTLWYAEVTDFTKLPDSYKLPNQSALDKMAEATKGSIAIPGVMFKSRQIIATRR
jgi:hypothetical protein